jgi:predicted metal-binding membrane protein
MRGARTESALVGLLLGVTGLAWWSSVDRMHGMDAGPWTAPGALGWFVGIWAVMMAAMMLPSAIPTVALYRGLARDRTLLSALLFVSGYLAIWAAVGLVAFALARVAGLAADSVLAWDHAGRWAAGTTLLLAAGYQLTPLKNACLARCRSPLAFLLGSWRPGRGGAMRMGATHGAWCVGCCWALMASLFALGVMSIAWAALVAGLVALEKLLPWRRVATLGTAAVFVSLGLLLVAAPELVPALTLPGGGAMPTAG